MRSIFLSLSLFVHCQYFSVHHYSLVAAIIHCHSGISHCQVAKQIRIGQVTITTLSSVFSMQGLLCKRLKLNYVCPS